MAKFNSETAKAAGKKSRRGPSKISLTMRQFLFELLNENREKLIYMMSELTPRQFVDTYLRLIPFIISQRHLQSFDINELNREEVNELIKDIMEQNETD
jgi:predicted ATPase